MELVTNIIDRALNVVAPEVAVRRAESRLKMKKMELAAKHLRKYDGASKAGRNKSWFKPPTGANTETATGLTGLRDASRDLSRNNPWAKRANEVLTHYSIGTGIRPEFKASNKKQSAGYKTAWEGWAESTECDANGQFNIYGLQWLAWLAVNESGGAILRRRRRASTDNLHIPIQIQLLESDFIDMGKTEKNGDNEIVQGVEFSPEGKRLYYWLWERHPGESISIAAKLSSKSKPVPAEDIIYLTKITRPGQIHGVPSGHTVINKLKDLEDANDNYLFRQKIAACFAAFVYDSHAEESSGESTLSDTIEPGTTEVLPPGKDIKFANPPGVEGFTTFHRDQLLAIATGFGITYEDLTADLKGVSFLSGRLGKISMHKNIKKDQALVIAPVLCEGVKRWFKDAADLTKFGGASSLKAEWIMPKVESIDPQKEWDVLLKKIRSGMPLFDGLKEMGYDDPERALERKALENKIIDKLKLVLDSDPRHMSAAGNPTQNDDTEKTIDTKDDGDDDAKENETD